MLKTMMIGNVGKIDGLTTAGINNTPLLKFSVAINKGPRERQTTTWMNCALWGKRAESISKFLKVGDKVWIDGELDIKTQEAKTWINVNVQDIELLSPRQQTQQKTPRPTGRGNTQYVNSHVNEMEQAMNNAHAPQPNPSFTTDEIPF